MFQKGVVEKACNQFPCSHNNVANQVLGADGREIQALGKIRRGYTQYKHCNFA
jgi:hypothetical protein